MEHHPIYLKQLNRVIASLDLSLYHQKTIFVSGGTGMIGACILDLLGLWNACHGGTISVIASTRNLDKVKRGENPAENIQWICWETSAPLELPPSVDYIIHTANNADPVNFARYPVETLWGAMAGTRSVLEYAREQQCKKILYVSSGEMYGQPSVNQQGELEDFTEDYCGAVNHKTPRAGYPTGKRGSEVLCQSYLQQYQVPTVIGRPCHIFGPTMLETDSRAVSEFFRNGCQGEDIVLKSEGLMERSHCYVVDCVSALFFLLEQGEQGEAYNITDQTYQMTIRDMAQAIAQAGGRSLRFDLPTTVQAQGFSPVQRAVLCGEKLQALGWKPVATAEKASAIQETMGILRGKQ